MSVPPENGEKPFTHPYSGLVSRPFATIEQARNSEFSDAAKEQDSHALRIGFLLGEFEILKKIGEGGFSIVYLAWDHSLERKVALKEYMPSSIAARSGETQIVPNSERNRDTFEAGLKSFINEGKLLAQFDHPALVKVYRFWRDNGTAYMVMPFYEGQTLRETIRALSSPPDELWFRSLLSPLMEALEVIHAENCYHRDIAPDNIVLLAATGKPLLLDFGAARRVIGDMTQSLTVILKPGYAPVEQYADIPGLTQGPWTDVYALAAVMYWAITGKPPSPSIGRMLSDSQQPLAALVRDRYSVPFLQAIDRALEVNPQDRTQNIAAFRQDMEAPIERTRLSQSKSIDPEATVLLDRIAIEKAPASVSRRAQALDSSSDSMQSLRQEPTGQSNKPISEEEAIGPSPLAVSDHERCSISRSETLIAPRTEKVQRVWIAWAAMAFLIIGGSIWWVYQRASSSGPAPVLIPKSDGTRATIKPEISASAPIIAPPSAEKIPNPTLSESVALLAGGTTSVRVSVAPQSLSIISGRDTLRFSVKSSDTGYLFVFGMKKESNELVLLYPDTFERGVSIEAGGTRIVRVAPWSNQPGGLGSWQLLAVVSKNARDFDKGGWRKRNHILVRDFGTRETFANPWGKVICSDPQRTCDDEYGLAAIQLEINAPEEQPASATSDRVTTIPQGAAKSAASSNARKASSTPKKLPANLERECADALQRASLGETGPALSEQLRKCG